MTELIRWWPVPKHSFVQTAVGPPIGPSRTGLMEVSRCIMSELGNFRDLIALGTCTAHSDVDEGSVDYPVPS